MSIPITYSLRSVAVRKGSAAMAIGGIALVVIVFATLLALGHGFEKAVATSGSEDNLIVLRKGADAELGSQVFQDTGRIVRELPLVARDENNEPLFMFESVLILLLQKNNGGSANINLRGTDPDAYRVHREVTVNEGRWFRPGTNEAIVGRALGRRMDNLAVGQTIVAGKREWKIVGFFDAQGSGLESEIWVDVHVLQAAFNRGNIYQSLLFRVSGDPQAAKKTLEATLDADPRLRSIQVWTEKEYYRKQSELMSSVITTLGTILSIIMSVGAIVGAMNTMYAAVAYRKREIGCLLSMGFPPESIWLAFIFESLLLSLCGAALGCGISLMFDGIKTGTTNWATFAETSFEFTMSWKILAESTGLALLLGFIGGFLPALQAARMNAVDALRRA